MSPIVTRETPHPGVALITMSNPEINNHGSWGGISELVTAMAAAREEGARVTVLASGVPGHWFEHAWLTDLIATFKGEPTTGDGGAWGGALHEIGQTDVVTIAAVSGDCSGGGAELGWACDLRIAEEQALFGQPEIQIALTTGIGGTSRLARIIGRTAAAEMVLDGTPMTARRIYELGGVNRVVPEGKSVEVAVEWAARLADRPAAGLAALKKILRENEDLGITDAMANEQKRFQEVASTPEAMETMIAIQGRFDAGESIRSVYGENRL
jgi:enoyl-CoA hydratase/carnithine racemase